MINGDIYRGATGGAGEFGHIMAVRNGRHCECGKYGCLEAYVAFHGTLATYAELYEAANQQSLLKNTQDVVHSVDQFYQQMEQGEQIAQEALRSTGILLGIHLASVVNLFNPECIIFTGEGTTFSNYLFAPMRQALQEYTFSQLGANLEIIFESWTGYESWARGAAALVLRRFFSVSTHAQQFPTFTMSS